MVKLNSIIEFIDHKEIAIVGASRNPKKFGNIILKNLIKRNFNVFPVNPFSAEILGKKCYPEISSLPENVKAIIFITKPDITEKLVKEAFTKGIRQVWFQQGAESRGAIEFASEMKMNFIYGQCLLMFLRPSMWVHEVHRFLKKVSGKYPK